MLERIAIAISGQDAAGWAALPENDRERLYGGGKWVDAGRTRQDYRDGALIVLEAMREPTLAMEQAVWTMNTDDYSHGQIWSAMLDAASKGG